MKEKQEIRLSRFVIGVVKNRKAALEYSLRHVIGKRASRIIAKPLYYITCLALTATLVVISFNYYPRTNTTSNTPPPIKIIKKEGIKPEDILAKLPKLLEPYGASPEESEIKTIASFKEFTDSYYKNYYEKKNAENRIPDLMPIQNKITSPFGERDPIPDGAGGILEGKSHHNGIDIKAFMGTPIKAAGSGVTIHAQFDEGWGYNILIVHGTINGKTLSTRYAHLSKISPNIFFGKWVEKGETIGLSGSTGRSSGPHLHYEIREDGMPVNPLNYIK